MKLYSDLAEYYFAIESHHRDIADDIALIRSLTNPNDSPALLDLGCGSGEHLQQITKYGIRCTGIDSSAEMLKIARRRFPGIEFIMKDMRKIDYYNDFDIALSLFGSFNYMIEDDDIDSVLWNTWRALREKGVGLFEIWNTLPVEKIKEKKITHVSTTTRDGTIIERERGFKMLPRTDKTVVEVNYIYRITDDNGSRTLTDRHTMRTFTHEEINKFFIKNGLTIKGIYSNTGKEPYHRFSNKMVIYFVKE